MTGDVRFDHDLTAQPVFRDDAGVARLLGSRCADCGRAAFPRRVVCLECGGAHEPLELRGRGTVHAAATVGNPPAGFDQGFRYACVDLAEGPRVLGPCVDDAIDQGRQVQAVVAAVRDGEIGFRFSEVRDA